MSSAGDLGCSSWSRPVQNVPKGQGSGQGCNYTRAPGLQAAGQSNAFGPCCALQSPPPPNAPWVWPESEQWLQWVALHPKALSSSFPGTRIGCHLPRGQGADVFSHLPVRGVCLGAWGENAQCQVTWWEAALSCNICMCGHVKGNKMGDEVLKGLCSTRSWNVVTYVIFHRSMEAHHPCGLSQLCVSYSNQESQS